MDPVSSGPPLYNRSFSEPYTNLQRILVATLACHCSPQERVNQGVGGHVDHQQLPGRTEVTLDRSGKENRDQRPDPAGGVGVAQADEVRAGVVEDQHQKI